MSDILDILSVGRDGLSEKKQKVEKPKFKKPEGMKRELYNLLNSDNSRPSPLIQSDFAITSKLGYPEYGYKKVTADLTLRKVRKWVWTPFKNPARNDDLQLSHWRRVHEKDQEFQFAKMCISPDIPTYTEQEYQELNLNNENWDKLETDYLLRMCKHHDLRFAIVHDRWDRATYKERSLEDIKDRYYAVYNAIKSKKDPKYQPFVYDADHEKNRKAQLEMLWNRTPEEVQEEQKLIQELRKIEQKKKEREKKKQDLVKLITAADTTTEIRRNEQQTHKQIQQSQSRTNRKKTNLSSRQSSKFDSTPAIVTPNIENAGIKFPETKTSGVWLRSSRMKLPASVGQKRMKAITQLLSELQIEQHPMPTEEICQHFNDLRSDMVLLYELKLALSSLEYELHSLKHQAETGTADELEKTIQQAISFDSSVPPTPTTPAPSSSAVVDIRVKHEPVSPKKSISEVIDVTGLVTPRKRRAALEQENFMRSLRKN